ncbi:MAG: hypothetical protein BWY67_01181 [Bacteroidetes bacterium ADurb.Bin397]|nr:MAG: hypothetical protein BWY67_01181 [Bacteroidetes bacterium ADurb.Bin397]
MSGNDNIFIGASSGNANTTGTKNIAIGFNSHVGTNLTNAIAIGNSAATTVSNSLVLGGTGINAVKVGIGTNAPTAELDVFGYTKLGNDAPKIRMKKMTSTLTAFGNGSTTFNHGLTSSKILQVTIFVENGSGNFYPPNYTHIPGVEYQYYITPTAVVVHNSTSNTSVLFGQPVTVLITYEE